MVITSYLSTDDLVSITRMLNVQNFAILFIHNSVWCCIKSFILSFIHTCNIYIKFWQICCKFTSTLLQFKKSPSSLMYAFTFNADSLPFCANLHKYSIFLIYVSLWLFLVAIDIGKVFNTLLSFSISVIIALKSINLLPWSKEYELFKCRLKIILFHPPYIFNNNPNLSSRLC